MSYHTHSTQHISHTAHNAQRTPHTAHTTHITHRTTPIEQIIHHAAFSTQHPVRFTNQSAHDTHISHTRTWLVALSSHQRAAAISVPSCCISPCRNGVHKTPAAEAGRSSSEKSRSGNEKGKGGSVLFEHAAGNATQVSSKMTSSLWMQSADRS